jgi:NADH-quinone oxidoreductase subunit A
MLDAYVPILILIGVSLANAVGMVVLSHLVSPFRPTPVKLDPYESGMTPLGDTRERFSVKFYMVAILFIVFDLETIYLLSWGVVMRSLGWQGFIAAFIFIVVLTVGMVYEWKKGALEWE